MITPIAPAGSSASRLPILLRLLLYGTLLVFFALLLRRLDLSQVWHVVRNTDWRLLLVALLLNLTINTFARVQRWRALLEPLPHERAGARFWQLTLLLFASYAANNLLPARTGEAVRTVQLHRQSGYAMGALVAAQMVEKIIEALSLGLLAVPVVFTAHPSPILAVPLAIVSFLGIAGLALIIIVARWRSFLASRLAPIAERSTSPIVEALRRFIARLADAVERMGSSRIWLRSLGWSWLSDLADLAMVGLCMMAVQIHLPVTTWFLVFVAVNLAIAVPSTPGQIGVLEASGVLALSVVGVPSAPALSFAILYHAIHLFPTTVIGLLGLLSYGGEWRRAEA